MPDIILTHSLTGTLFLFMFSAINAIRVYKEDMLFKQAIQEKLTCTKNSVTLNISYRTKFSQLEQPPRDQILGEIIGDQLKYRF